MRASKKRSHLLHRPHPSRIAKLFALAIGLTISLCGCLEKPHSEPVSKNNSMFSVASFGRDINSPAVDHTSLTTDVPDRVLFYLKVCLKDMLKNDQIPPDTHFSIINPETNQSMFTGTTDPDGCLHWTEKMHFEYFAKNQYLEQVREIVGLDRFRGRVFYHFALDPWNVAMGSHSPSILDLKFHNKAPGAQIVPAKLAHRALAEKFQPRTPKLYLKNIHAVIEEDRFLKMEGRVRVIIDATPVLILHDVTGAVVQRTITFGDIELVPALIAQVPNLKAGHNITELVDMTKQPMPIEHLQILPSGNIHYVTTTTIPLRQNRGNIRLALRAYATSIPAIRVKGQSLLQNEYDALLDTAGHDTTPIGTFTSIFTDSMTPSKTGHLFSLDEYMKKVISNHTMLAKVNQSVEYDPYEQEVDGFTPLRYEITKLAPLYVGVGPSPDRVDTAKYKETNLDRYVRYSVYLCYSDPFTRAPLANAEFKIYSKSFGVKVEHSDEDGCLRWFGDVHQEYYHTQKMAYLEPRIVSREFGIDQRLYIAINLWETSGFIFARDERFERLCPKGKFLVRALDQTGTPIERPNCLDHPSPCKDGDWPIYKNGINGPLTCLPKDQLQSYALQARLKDLRSDPNDHPHIFLNGDNFSYYLRQITYRINRRLDIKIKRTYIFNFTPMVYRTDNLTNGLQKTITALRAGYYYLRLVVQRNKQDEAGAPSEQHALHHTNCFDPKQFHDPRPDKGYMDSWQGVVILKNGQIVVPVTFNFTALWTLLARDQFLVELTPIDEHKSHIVEMQDPRVDIETVNQKASTWVEAKDSGLAPVTYRGNFIPVDERGSITVQASPCETATDVIKAGMAYRKKMEELAAKLPPAKPQPFYNNDPNVISWNLPNDSTQISSFMNDVNRAPGQIVGINGRAGKYAPVFPPIVRYGKIDFNKINMKPEDLAQIISYYAPRDAYQPGAITRDQYLAKRYLFLRKLCYYWTSGKIYPDLFHMPNPFVYHGSKPSMIYSAVGPYPAYFPMWSTNHSCNNPEQLFSVDRSIMVNDIDKSNTEYLAGQAWSLAINNKFDESLKASDDANVNQSDSFTLNKFRAGVSVPLGIMGDVGAMIGSFIHLDLFGVSAQHNYNSSRAYSNSEGTGTGVDFGESIHLAVNRLTFSIPVTRYRQCMLIKPYISPDGTKQNDFESGLHWMAGITQKQKNDYMSKGLFICLAENDTPTPIYEDYFFLTQFFNPTPAYDHYRRINRPWLYEIRGFDDYVKFKAAAESLNRIGGYAGMAKTAHTRLPGQFLSPSLIRADHRFPSLDGVYTIRDNLNLKADPKLQSFVGEKKCFNGFVGGLRLWWPGPETNYDLATKMKSLSCPMSTYNPF